MRAILRKKTILLLILFFCFADAFSRDFDANSDAGALQNAENKNLEYPQYAPLVALVEVAGINAVVHLFDRYILNADYAQVSLNDIGNNFSKGFVWDNDNFSTNTFFHPYHGSLYFNAARANGLSFWQSVPYTFAGSFMWEFFCENTYPSINDFINTSIGGVALGEMTHRLSALVLDDSAPGAKFWRASSLLWIYLTEL